jgi:transcriptional regulator with XRE-family HTH domain
MSVPVWAARLSYELALRGMTAFALAKLAGVSPATVSAALAGKNIAATSLKLMADALETIPVSDFMRRLIGPFSRWPGGDASLEPAGEDDG